MDYSRVYAEFIADRRLREPGLQGYSEKHHIKPRYLGGDNSKANLIRLTPEDHFFAHLCLGKIHGGRMWSPISFMLGKQRKHWRARKSRLTYGWAARKQGEIAAERGKLSTIHVLVNKDGREWQGRQCDMPEALGMGRPLANLLVKRRIKSALGWHYPDTVNPGRQGGSNHPYYNTTTMSLVRLDGQTFTGTQHEFVTQYGASKSAANRLLHGKTHRWREWRAAPPGGG